MASASPIPPLPPGQRARPDFPRFGVTRFAQRFPREVERIELTVGGDVTQETCLGGEMLQTLPRIDLTADFHCVTTWSAQGLRWSGFRYRDFHAQFVLPLAQPRAGAEFVILRGQDGARTSLPLTDLLADDILLVDRLDGAPLNVAHGAPLRLVAPAHYGYKSVKHLSRLEFWTDDRHFRPSGFASWTTPAPAWPTRSVAESSRAGSCAICIGHSSDRRSGVSRRR